MAAVDLKYVDPSNTIEFQRTVINDIATDIHAVYTGTADLKVTSLQVGGADVGAIAVSYTHLTLPTILLV